MNNDGPLDPREYPRALATLPCRGGKALRDAPADFGAFTIGGENYFRAEIAAGRVGPEQAAPRREFD